MGGNSTRPLATRAAITMGWVTHEKDLPPTVYTREQIENSTSILTHSTNA